LANIVTFQCACVRARVYAYNNVGVCYNEIRYKNIQFLSVLNNILPRMYSVPLIFNILHHKAIICSYKCLSTSILLFFSHECSNASWATYFVWRVELYVCWQLWIV